MSRTLKFSAIFLCLCVVVPAAYTHENCSLQSFEGTYAIYERGSSLVLDPSSQNFFPLWGGAIAQFANIAEITFNRGIGNGFYWIWAGAIPAQLDPTPVHVNITEMNPDCTGKLTYDVNLAPGVPTTTIEERFILFDNGREFRSVPSSIVNGIPFLTWLGTGHRISNSRNTIHSCGPHTAQGRYLLSCENIIKEDPNTAFADTFQMITDVSMTGHYTGRLYERQGPFYIDDWQVSGTMTVNRDCSFTGTLDVPGFTTILEKGVFYNEGKDYYVTGILSKDVPVDQQGIKYSFCQATRIGE